MQPQMSPKGQQCSSHRQPLLRTVKRRDAGEVDELVCLRRNAFIGRPKTSHPVVEVASIDRLRASLGDCRCASMPKGPNAIGGEQCNQSRRHVLRNEKSVMHSDCIVCLSLQIWIYGQVQKSLR